MNEYINLRKIPLLRLLFIFIPGIIITYRFFSFLSDYVFVLFCTTVFLALFLIFLSFKKQSPKLHDFLIHILVFEISIFLTAIVLPNNNFNIDKSKIYTAETYNIPQLKDKSILIPAKITHLSRLGFPKRNKINIYVKKDSLLSNEIDIGSTIIFKGNIQLIKNYGNPGEFDYKHFMASKAIFYQVWVKPGNIKVLNTGVSKKSHWLFIGKIKSYVYSQTDKYINDIDSRALIVAFITGDRELISDEMRDSYVHAGVIHILSVSGLHIGIIFMFLNFLLKPFDYNSRLRFIKTLIIILAVWFYALISGLSTSVVRSALMFSLISAGQTFRRDISIYNILAASALIMLMFNPMQLFDIGFQLSYIAVAGIVYFQPKFDRLFNFSNKIANYVYQLFIVSFAAQLATLPLLLYYFNQFSVYFWLANLFVIPLTFLLMILIVTFLLTSFIPLFGSILGIACSSIALVVNKFVVLVEELPGSVAENIFIGRIDVVLIFCLILFLIFWAERKSAKALVSSIVFINLILVLNIIRYNQFRNKEILTIYNTPQLITIGIFSPGKSFIFSNASDEKSLLKVKLACDRHWREYNKNNLLQISSIDSIAFKLPVKSNIPKMGNKVLKLSGDSKLFIYSKFSHILRDSLFTKKDILFVANNLPPPENHITVKGIVLFPGIMDYCATLWEDYANKNKSEIINIRKMGAYSVEL